MHLVSRLRRIMAMTTVLLGMLAGLGVASAQACQHSQQDDSHRQDAAQTGNQMHETKTPSPNTKRSQCRLFI